MHFFMFLADPALSRKAGFKEMLSLQKIKVNACKK
jgi:hypothetical protein